MADEKREVNFSEEVKLDESVGTEETDLEDIETSDDEKETQEESSPQENQEDKSEENVEEIEQSVESTEKQEESSVVSQEPKPVEGETPREKALRLETQRLRKDLRDERNKKVFEGYKPEVKDELSKEEQEVLNQYDQKELSQFEKIIDVIAKKKGLVKKGDFQATTYQQQATDVLDGWLETHKEYLPENDKDNILWNQFQAELKLYQKPSNPRDLKRVFDRVHREVFGISSGIDTNKINAQKEKIKVASHTGANQKPRVIKQPTTLDPSLKDHLKGFTDEEKKEIFDE